ncbi:unnamed protein product [Closterium sp. NIES-53]
MPRAQRESGHKVKVIRSDNGGEFIGADFEAVLKKKGIQHQLTVPYNPQQNGVAERFNRTLQEGARTLLGRAGLPDPFWVTALRQVALVKNRVLATVGDKQWVPYTKWYGSAPAANMLRAYCCMVVFHVPKEKRGKLEAYGRWGVHLGLAKDHKGWLIWDLTSQQLTMSRDRLSRQVQVTVSEEISGVTEDGGEPEVEELRWRLRVLQQQGQPQHSRQWGLAGPKSPDHSVFSCYRRHDDLHRESFGPHAITPHWPSRLRQRTATPVESHLPGLGPFPAARVETCVSSLGACVVSRPGASEGLCVGAVATTSQAPAFVAGSGATSQTAQLSFTLDSGASSCFFRDCTDLTPLHSPVTVALANPSAGPVVSRSTTTLPCPAAPFGFLTGYYTPLFCRNLVGVTHLHDLGVVTTFPLDEPVASCTFGANGAPLATFHRESGSGLYSLHTGSHHTELGLPESLAPLPRSPVLLCTPCVESWQRAAPHSSSFPPTMAPF